MIFLILTGIIFFTEYYVKQHMDKVYTQKDKRCLAGGRIVLRKYYNSGAAGNFLSSRPECVCLLHTSVLTAVWTCFLYVLPKKGLYLVKTGLSFLAGGGLSNLYDRIRKGHVVDYISFGFGPGWFQKLVFNSADFFVFAGILLGLIQFFKKEGNL